MTKRKLFAALMGGVLSTAIAFPYVNAAKIDAYRDILLQGSYTIRYENITPPPRVTNRDKMDLFGKNGMSVEKNDYLTNRQRIGIIVGDGEDRYEEVGDGQFNMCRLTKGKEEFYFTKYKKGDKYVYFGTKENKVEANSKNYLSEIVEGQSYGDADVSRLLKAMFPADKKTAGQAVYAYVKGGTLSDGTSYEDYKGIQNGMTSVIRYYFQGQSLTKIASANYHRTPEGSIDGYKCIVRVTEFTSVPDKALLKLPEGVEDVTKRKDKEKK
ncbi:MAG: hypothetical protein IJT01_11205 [Selenomonadaceae bacterium]|nr:hypothetical protein [Selenomonadaceae bacterium]